MTFRKDIILEDTTLRDGEQAPGLCFSNETKLAIFDALIGAGVRWIEGGIHSMGGSESRTLKQMLERTEGTNVKLVGWNRGVLDDVKASLDLGFKVIHIGLPTSDIHLRDSVNKSKSWLLEQACHLVDFAKQRGAFVSISAEDVGRSELSFVTEYAGAVREAGADRLRLSDTVGILTPEKYQNIVSTITEAVQIDTQCHAHNDFGLAVSNTLAGLKGGARYFHVTVNGIGERAGMPDLAQVAVSLKVQYDIDLGLDLTKLTAVSELVAQATHSRLHPWQPIVGQNVFAHESGIHAKGSLNNGHAFEPFSPELLGRERSIVVGKHSGRASLKHALDALGIHHEDHELTELLYWVREVSMIKKQALTYKDVALLHAGVSRRGDSCRI